MPRRTDPHTQGGYVRAAFIVAHEEPSRLSAPRAAQIIERILDLEEPTFREYGVIVEHSPRIGNDLIPAIDRPDLPPGHVEVRSLEEVHAYLEEKYEHESPKHRRKGLPSYRAPAFLQSDVLAIVVGCREFLHMNVELYLDRKPLKLLQEVLIASRRICGLAEPSRAGKNHAKPTFCRVPEVGSLRVWGGNFDALWEHGNRQRLSTEEVFARIGGRARPDELSALNTESEPELCE